VPVRLGPAPFAKFSVHENKVNKPGVQVQTGPTSIFRPSAEFLIKTSAGPPTSTIKFGFGEHDLGSRKGIDFKTKDGKLINLSFDKDPAPVVEKDIIQTNSDSCLKPSLTRRSFDEKEYKQFLGQLGHILSSKAEFV
jgi:hypothetical protein